LAPLLAISRDVETIRIGNGVDTKTTAGKSLLEGAPVFSIVPRLLGLNPRGAKECGQLRSLADATSKSTYLKSGNKAG